MASRVYFVQAENGLIKIGRTRNLERRLNSLGGSSSQSLKLLASTPGGSTLELHLHEVFADLRRHGEWFDPAPHLLSYISKLQIGLPPALPAGFGADADDECASVYEGSRAQQAASYAKRLLDLESLKGVAVKDGINRLAERLRVKRGAITVLLYRSPRTVSADLYFGLRSLLADELARRLRDLENELLAVRRSTLFPIRAEELHNIDAEVARIRRKIAAFREAEDLDVLLSTGGANA